MLEDGDFIPILRTQTKLTWRHERSILPRHGMREGLAIADICCGIGDFAVLVSKEFKPCRLVAVDHAKPSLAYAGELPPISASEVSNTSMATPQRSSSRTTQFDFVTCRHSLQIFNKPELILKELYRICKPGGRVYVTNEKISHCLGEPRGESIHWTYNELSRLFAHYDMDLEFGPKSRRYLDRAGFDRHSHGIVHGHQSWTATRRILPTWSPHGEACSPTACRSVAATIRRSGTSSRRASRTTSRLRFIPPAMPGGRSGSPRRGSPE